MIIKKNRFKNIFFILSLLILFSFLLMNFKNVKLGNIDQELRILLKQPVLFSYYNNPKKNINNFFYSLKNILNNQNFDTIKIDISFKNFEKIKKDRTNSFKSGILRNPTRVNADITFNEIKYPATIRLKGDFNDHRNYNKQWSLKINLKNKKTILGFNEFSLLSHSTRAYPDSFIIRKNLQRIGLIVPSMTTVKVRLNGDDWGLMALEEHFSNNYFETKYLKEVPVFRLSDEEHMTVANKFDQIYKLQQINNYDQIKNNLTRFQGIYNIHTYNKENILKKTNIPNEKTNLNLNSLIMNLNEIAVNSETFTKQINIDKEKIISKYFDVNKFALAIGSSLLWGENHSLYEINSRFFINPYTQKIEPIPNDFHYSQTTFKTKKNDIIEKNIEEANINFQKFFDPIASIYKFVISSKEFKKEYIKSLKLLEENLPLIIKDYYNFCKPFGKICSTQSAVYGFSIDEKRLKNNLQFLKHFGIEIFNFVKFDNNQKITRINDINPKFNNLLKKNIYARIFNDGEINVLNISNFDVNISKIEFLKYLNCSKNCDNNAITFYPNKSLLIDKINTNSTLVSKSIKQNFYTLSDNKNFNIYNYDVAKIYYKTEKLNKIYILDIENQKFKTKKILQNNYEIPNFVKNFKNNFIIKEGYYKASQPIIISKNKDLLIESGVNIDFLNNSFIYLNGGCLIINGTNENQIYLKSEDNIWNGIHVINCNKKNIIKNVNFKNLSYFNHEYIQLTGAINFYNTSIEILDSNFDNSISEDFLNIINSEFLLKNLKFNNSISDAIDIDFSKGKIENIEINKVKGDAIDTSGSTVFLNNIFIKEIDDKSISVGENSIVNLNNIFVDNSSIGIAVKDGSKVYGKNLSIENSKLFDVAVFKKKNFYSGGYANLDNVKHQNKLINQIDSYALINNEIIKQQKFNSKKLYQNEIRN